MHSFGTFCSRTFHPYLDPGHSLVGIMRLQRKILFRKYCPKGERNRSRQMPLTSRRRSDQFRDILNVDSRRQLDWVPWQWFAETVICVCAFRAVHVVARNARLLAMLFTLMA